MLRSLRAGNTTIEYFHEYGSDTVLAINTSVELKSDHAVFSATLKPIDTNQKEDLERLLFLDISTLTKVVFNDLQIRQKTHKFLNAYKEQISFVKLQLIYDKSYFFNVGLNPENDDGLLFTIKM